MYCLFNVLPMKPDIDKSKITVMFLDPLLFVKYKVVNAAFHMDVSDFELATLSFKI